MIIWPAPCHMQHMVANEALQQLVCRAGIALKLSTHIIKRKRDRKPLQLGWGQAAASSCLKAFLTAVKSVNHRIIELWMVLWRKISPGFSVLFNHKPLICNRVEFSAALFPRLFSCGSWWRRRGEGKKIIRLFQFLPFQGLQDCLFKTVILLLQQLPLELLSQHILSLLLVIRRGFFSFFLFLSFFFSIPFFLLLLLCSERAREMKRVLRASALLTLRKECVSLVYAMAMSQQESQKLWWWIFSQSVCLDAQVRSTFSRFCALRHIWKGHPFYIKSGFFFKGVK